MRAAPLLVVLLLFAACELAEPSADEWSGAGRWRTANRDPGAIVVGRPADALSLDPARVTDNESAEVCEQIYDSLLRYQPGSNAIEPGLARTYDVSADGREWTFHLREGVRFHDGTPLDAAAVVFSFKRQLDEDHPYHKPDATGLAFAWGNTYRNVIDVVPLDTLTVRITIERRYAPFMANLAMFSVAIVSPAAVERWGKDYYRHPVGTGPFRFVGWEGGRIVLERNDDYWDHPAEAERLIFVSMPDGRQRLVALESGAIDVAYSILPDEQQFVALHPGLKLYLAPANNVAYLAFNTQKPPFDDLRVRRAFNHAINKEPITKLAYQGLAVAAQGPLPPTQWGHHPGVRVYEHSAATARRLLEEASADGVFDPDHEFFLYVPVTPRPYLPNPEMVGRIIRSNLAEIGVRTVLVEQGIHEHLKSVRRGEHDLCVLGWVGDNGDPDNFLYVLLDPDNSVEGVARNVAFFRDDAVHELLIAAQQSGSRSEREQIYIKAQERITEQAPWVPLAHSQVSVAARSDIGGMVINPSTHVYFRGVSRR